MIPFEELTPKEQKAIRQLRRVAKTWPASLWLFAGGSAGGVYVMKAGEDLKPVMAENGGVHPDYLIETIYGFHADGGDW